MEIKFNGDFSVKKTPQEVYDFLVDPKRFCPLLPDYESMEILDDKNFLVLRLDPRAEYPRLEVIRRMARLSEISFADRAPEGAVQLLVRGEVAALPLKGVIDLAAEKTRLDKEIAKADADIKRVDAKLGNEKFVANAPEEIVEEEKEKREAAVARREKIVEALKRLQEVDA